MGPAAQQLLGLLLMASAIGGILWRMEKRQRRDVTPQWQPHMATEQTVKNLAAEDAERVKRFIAYEKVWEKKWEAQGLAAYTTKRGFVKWIPKVQLGVVAAGAGRQ